MRRNLLVVGAGPAGLATAVFAGLAGFQVAVIDKREGPIDKACGEGLVHTGLELLQQAGVQLDHNDGHPFAGIRYIDGPYTAVGLFPHPGLGIRRVALVSKLRQRAEQLGVQFRDDVKLLSWRRKQNRQLVATTSAGDMDTDLIVGADGLHSRVRELAKLSRPNRAVRRFGVRRHYHVQPWSSYVDVHWDVGAEAYITPVNDHTVNVAFLWGGSTARFDEILQRFPALSHLRHATHVSETRGAGPLRQDVITRYTEDIALVGDAAGYSDAITGEGLTLGFRAAHALIKVLARDADLAEYEVAYQRISRSYYLLTRSLLWLATHPRWRRAVMATLAYRPVLFTRALRYVGAGA